MEIMEAHLQELVNLTNPDLKMNKELADNMAMATEEMAQSPEAMDATQKLAMENQNISDNIGAGTQCLIY